MNEFFVAVQTGNVKAVIDGIESGASSGFKSSLPLNIACRNRQFQMVFLLLQDRSERHWDCMALTTAIENGDWQIIRILVCDERIPPISQHAFECMCTKRDSNALSLVMSVPRMEAISRANSLFISYCREGDYGGVEYLLQNTDIDPAQGHNCALQIASQNHYSELVNLLISYPAVRNESPNLHLVDTFVSLVWEEKIYKSIALIQRIVRAVKDMRSPLCDDVVGTIVSMLVCDEVLFAINKSKRYSHCTKLVGYFLLH